MIDWDRPIEAIDGNGNTYEAASGMVGGHRVIVIREACGATRYRPVEEDGTIQYDSSVRIRNKPTRHEWWVALYQVADIIGSTVAETRDLVVREANDGSRRMIGEPVLYPWEK